LGPPLLPPTGARAPPAGAAKWSVCPHVALAQITIHFFFIHSYDKLFIRLLIQSLARVASLIHITTPMSTLCQFNP
jgi:hypothetical protein